MKLRNLLTSVVTMAILAGITTAQIGYTNTPPITFIKRPFETTMTSGLNGKVMGYQHVLPKKRCRGIGRRKGTRPKCC